MARSRNIKPGLFKNELLGEADPYIVILFTGLWCLADKQGRLEDRPKRISAEIFPYRYFESSIIDGYLDWLDKNEFILRYEMDGKSYIQVKNWEKHQCPHHREVDSVIPQPIEGEYKNRPCAMHDSCMNDASTKQVAPCPTDSLIPDSLIPDSLIPDSLIPDSLIPDSLLFTGGVEKNPPPLPKIRSNSKKQNKEMSPSYDTWKAYSDAYHDRYGVTPVRNATVNAQISSFIKRIGFEESPLVAAFFVNHNNQFYVQKMHTVGLLLADAEKLRTEWATKKTITNAQARQIDRKQSTADVFNQLLEENRMARNG